MAKSATAADLAQRASEATQAHAQAQAEAQAEARVVEMEQLMMAQAVAQAVVAQQPQQPQQPPPLLPLGEAHTGLVGAGNVFAAERGWTALSGDEESRMLGAGVFTPAGAAPASPADEDFYAGAQGVPGR